MDQEKRERGEGERERDKTPVWDTGCLEVCLRCGADCGTAGGRMAHADSCYY